MDNRKRLEEILKLRELRNNLNNLNISLEEKEVLRNSFNYYENILNLDITRTNLNKEELDSENIPNDFEVIEVPVEHSLNKYNEYAKVSNNEIIAIINKLSSNLEFLNLTEQELKVVLNSLKEYSIYLIQLKELQKSNQALYNEIMTSKSK